MLLRRIYFIAFAILAFAGCNFTTVSDQASTLAVDFGWTEKSGCSSISPPIKVTDIPEETKYLKVTMVDLDMPTYDHGGGEVTYNGISTITEGTLKAYSGPCPPPGTEHTYEITVQALSADKKLVIGQGKAIKKFSK
jgi:hypothetical protein